jgi:hypothetical protein
MRMSPSGKRQGLPWGLLLASGVLIGLDIFVFRVEVPSREPQPWKTVLAAWVAAGAVLLFIRELHGGFWGLIAGGLLTLHPWFQEAAVQGGPVFWAQSAALAVLAATVLSERLVYNHVFLWIRWFSLAVLLCLGVGLSWFWQIRVGLLAALLVGSELLPMAVPGLALRRRRSEVRPAWSNLLTVVAVGVLIPLGGLVLGSVSQGVLAVKVFAHLEGTVKSLVRVPDAGVTLSQLEPLCWPNAWAIGVVTVWAVWRSLRRGLWLWRCGQPPVSWSLTMALICVASWMQFLPVDELPNAHVLILALIVGLTVFLVADLLRGLMERLVLRPPPEEAAMVRR